MTKPDAERGTGGVFDAGGARYPNDSKHSQQTDGGDSQIGSTRYQSDSDGTRSSPSTPSSSDSGAEPADYFTSMAEAPAIHDAELRARARELRESGSD